MEKVCGSCNWFSGYGEKSNGNQRYCMILPPEKNARPVVDKEEYCSKWAEFNRGGE